MLGLAASTFHGVPGFRLATYLGIIPPGVVEGAAQFYLAAVDGVIWGAVYGFVGWVVDALRARRTNDG